MHILLVEDDIDFRATAEQWLVRHGHRVAASADARSALALATEQCFDVAILDLNLPDASGLDLLSELKSAAEDLEVIILTAAATVETAVEAMRRGAYDYLTKPFPLARLTERCLLAAERGRLTRENRQLKRLLQRDHSPTQMIGESPRMREIQRLIERIAPTGKAVLILGESGTGKELVARSLLERSDRASSPFVTINCAALPESLVESELFGHEKGAFTGAVSRKEGLFEIADGGTLFIDEIGELPLALQPKLLRILENGSLRRVGSHQERRVNVRIIAATNRDMQTEVAHGRFREDLYYRINVLTIQLPPLRERRDDIPRLLTRFLPPGWRVDPEAEQALLSYAWPGNVRQLLNAVDRATILAEDQVITLDDLPDEVAADVEPVDRTPTAAAPSDNNLAAVERAHIQRVLDQAHGNKALAAKLLGIHRRKLYRLLARFQLV